MVARFNSPHGLVRDRQGFIYVLNGQYGSIVRVISPEPDAYVSILVGSHESGRVAGRISLDVQGNLYVTSGQNYGLRKVIPDGAVATVGAMDLQSGSTAAQMNETL